MIEHMSNTTYDWPVLYISPVVGSALMVCPIMRPMAGPALYEVFLGLSYYKL